MFGFLSSEKKKMRVHADNWVELAMRVWHFRRDQLTEPERKELASRTEALRKARKDGAEPGKLKLAIEELEGVLRRTGGRIYPKSSIAEYVEFFMVAAIVILGIRTYFVQPFKIPTNSMWPSYYGMTAEVYRDPAKAPGPVAQAARFLMFGARRKQVIAPVSGPIRVPVVSGNEGDGGGKLQSGQKPSRRWFLFPSMDKEFTFDVNGSPVRVQVPEDFDFDLAFREAFDVTAAQMIEAAGKSGPLGVPSVRWVTLDRQAVAGEPIMTFDIMTGDQLFVDRISYHFFRPSVGQGFVFRTGNIPGIAVRYGDQYYIKRLVGLPGDTLEIQEPTLLRNGKPITGASAFDKNAGRVERYAGYFNGPSDRGDLLLRGTTATVPKEFFLALGDNSANSFDGRYWGFVPAKDVVGKPLFIYYPFTRRLGQNR